MSTVAYPITIGDAASGGVSVTVTAFSISDSATVTESTPNVAQVSTAVVPAPVYSAPGTVAIPAGSSFTIRVPPCIPVPTTIRNITVYYHCPYETIPPSLFNNRLQIALLQLPYVYAIQQIMCTYNNSYCNVLNNAINELQTASPVSYGDLISHQHWNTLYDFINAAYKLIQNLINYKPLFSYVATIQSFLRLYSHVKTGVVLTSESWNMLTESMEALDYILNALFPYPPVIIKFTNQGYTYQYGQQFPIQINVSNFNSTYKNYTGYALNEDLSNAYFVYVSPTPTSTFAYAKAYSWIEVDANHNNGNAIVWVKPPNDFIDKLNNDGAALLVMFVSPNNVIDGNIVGENMYITGNASTDNIANVMDPGLLWTWWANTSVNLQCQVLPPGICIGVPPVGDPLTGASLNASSLTYSTQIASYTVTPYIELQTTQSTTYTSSLPCTSSGCPSSVCSTCYTVNNVLINMQSNYCCGASAPTSGYNPALAKFIGFIQSQTSNTVYAIVDDALKLYISLGGELGTDGANWTGNVISSIVSWTNQSVGKVYSTNAPAGTFRFTIHYENADPARIYLGVWFANSVNAYHAKFVPNGYMPQVTFLTPPSFAI